MRIGWKVEDLPGKLLLHHLLVHDTKPVLPLEDDGKLGGIIEKVLGLVRLISLTTIDGWSDLNCFEFLFGETVFVICEVLNNPLHDTFWG